MTSRNSQTYSVTLSFVANHLITVWTTPAGSQQTTNLYDHCTSTISLHSIYLLCSLSSIFSSSLCSETAQLLLLLFLLFLFHISFVLWLMLYLIKLFHGTNVIIWIEYLLQRFPFSMPGPVRQLPTPSSSRGPSPPPPTPLQAPFPQGCVLANELTAKLLALNSANVRSSQASGQIQSGETTQK